MPSLVLVAASAAAAVEATAAAAAVEATAAAIVVKGVVEAVAVHQHSVFFFISSWQEDAWA